MPVVLGGFGLPEEGSTLLFGLGRDGEEPTPPESPAFDVFIQPTILPVSWSRRHRRRKSDDELLLVLT